MTPFSIYLIKPTRYDDEGYPLQWWRSITPSNSLACVEGIVRDAVDRRVLGDNVDIRIVSLDEIHNKIAPARIIRDIRAKGGKALIGFVGVQSNQFPRTMDLAAPFRAAGLPVLVGGFHVSGCLAMLKDMPPDLIAAQATGVSFFAGEAEDGRIDEVLHDAYAGALKPIYNHLKNTPNLAGAPIPLLSENEIAKNINHYASFDLGRGCPYECSFCTIINVQGRKSRFRTPDDLERIISENAARGVNRFLITDDNFARNKLWESFLDRLIALRQQGMNIRLSMQVDTLAYKLKGFIEKSHLAGADQVFIGLESINADSLEAVKKRQNRLEDYREMFLAWKKYHFVITCGYIVGFPTDTYESILRDMETIKREFPIDTIYLNYLTPLPGSEDHRKMHDAGVWMDPDMNKYDLNHRVTHHERMTDAEWEAAYREAHASFYSFEHMETVLRRMFALGSNKKHTTVHRLLAYREAVRLEGCAMLEAGYVRIRRRTQRRAGLPLENPLVFYPRNAWRLVATNIRIFRTYWRLRQTMLSIFKDPERKNYRDRAIIDDGDDSALINASRTTEYSNRRRNRAHAAE